VNRTTSVLTLIAIACCAYAVADLAHETLGHGGACLASGGKVLLIDTTFEDCSVHSRWIDGAGPLTGIAVALLAWLGARNTQIANWRVFLVLLFADAMFWNIGYMIKSGIAWSGDWHFLIKGLQPANILHIAIAAAGIALYIAVMRMLVGVWPTGRGISSGQLAVIAYLTAAILSAAAGFLDPHGPHAILSDALPSSLGAVGLPLVGLRQRTEVGIVPSPTWIVVGAISAVIFVAILGPGIKG